MRSFWHCVVEVDIPEGCLPRGADQQPREAVERAIESLHPDTVILENNSGWGLSAFGAKHLISESSKQECCISREDSRRRSIPKSFSVTIDDAKYEIPKAVADLIEMISLERDELRDDIVSTSEKISDNVYDRILDDFNRAGPLYNLLRKS